MSNAKTFRCAACGAQLDLNHVRNGQVACEYCGSVNYIEKITQNSQILDKQNINSGFQLSATKADLHKKVLNVIASEQASPIDIFEKVRIIRENRICLPVFMFNISATANFMYEQGYDREKQELYNTKNGTSYRTVRYTEWVSQSSNVSNTGFYFSPGTKNYAALFAAFASHLNVSELIDIEELSLPSDVILHEFNYPMAASYSEYVQPMVDADLKARAEQSLVGKNWRNGNMQGTNAHKDEIQRVYYPFYHIEYEYNGKTYNVYVSNDGKYAYHDGTVVDVERQAKIQKCRDAVAKLKPKSNVGWIVLIILSVFVGFALIGGIGENWNPIAGGIIGLLVGAGGCVFPIMQIMKNKKAFSQLKAEVQAKYDAAIKEYTDRIAVFVDKKVAFQGIYESVTGDEKAFILE